VDPAAVLLLCLPLVGDTIVRGPTAPPNARGAIDSTLETLGPIYLDHTATVGAGKTNVNLLAQTTPYVLGTSTGVDLRIRATTVVLAASHGVTDHLDASLVLPILQETVEAAVRQGPISGHTTTTVSGASDLGARLKYHVAPGVAATLEATFPTGDPTRGLGTGDYWLSPGLVATITRGPVQLSARAAFDVNLSRAGESTVSYGASASVLLWPHHLALAAEVLGQSAPFQLAPIEILGIDYSARHVVDVVVGVRVPITHNVMAFVAGSYALVAGGLRADGVFPTAGVGGTF
jgi:hypothetical protein